MTTDDTPLFPPYARKVATVNLTYKGVPVALQFADMNTAELEKAIDGLMGRAGWSVPEKEHTPPQSMPRKPAAAKVEPSYNASGEPCCPTHGRVLKEGRWGLFCSAKDQTSGEYCKLKFDL